MHCHGPKAGTPIKCFPTREEAMRMHRAIMMHKVGEYNLVESIRKLDSIINVMDLNGLN